MTAVDSALQLYELLEAILLHLPPTNITRAMRTSKTWRSVIENSTSLQNRRILATSPDPSLSNLRPHYAPGETIRAHRIFYVDLYPLDPPDNRQGVTHFFYYIDHAAVKELGPVLNDFVCFPPAQKVHLETSSKLRCTLYVKTGICIKDVVEVGKAMYEGRKGGRDRGDFIVIGEFVQQRLSR